MVSSQSLHRVFFCLACLWACACGGGEATTCDEVSTPCGRVSSNSLQTADLLFVADMSGMGAAVSASTGVFTHVDIVVREAEPVVYDATPGRGVARCSWSAWVAQTESPVVAMRLTGGVDTVEVVRRLQTLLGKPYDLCFLPDNDAYYCSELVQAVCVDSGGGRLFDGTPMNFLAADGTLPTYWERLFDSLQMAVPQGVEGTNPSQLAASPLLVRLGLVR